jgi:hypothetical protein
VYSRDNGNPLRPPLPVHPSPSPDEIQRAIAAADNL